MTAHYGYTKFVDIYRAVQTLKLILEKQLSKDQKQAPQSVAVAGTTTPSLAQLVAQSNPILSGPAPKLVVVGNTTIAPSVVVVRPLWHAGM